MARTLILVDTSAYTRTHGMRPTVKAGKGLWAFTIDGHEAVQVKYGFYKDALIWAKTQATATVTVLP